MSIVSFYLRVQKDSTVLPLRLLQFRVCHAYSIIIYYTAEPIHGEKEYSDWFPEQSDFAIRTIKMDRSLTDFTDLFY